MSRQNKPRPMLPQQALPSPHRTMSEISVMRFPDDTFDIRYFASDIERARSKRGTRIRFPHLRPHSVCVYAIGNTWEPSAWQKVVDMVAHTNKKGVCCWLTEVRDTCVHLPYVSLNTMKDAACMWAHDMGFEYILLIDNDILPEPDLALRLINWDMPIVVPYIRDKRPPKQAEEIYERDKAKVLEAYQKTKDKKAYEEDLAIIKENKEKGTPVANPAYRPNKGLQPMLWAALSCILISCRVLNCFPECAPFGNVNIESGFYNKLMHYGHKIFQDTNLELKVATRPTYPADNRSMKAMWEFWERADVKRRSAPNRKPIDPEDKRDVYLPKEWGIKPTSVDYSEALKQREDR